MLFPEAAPACNKRPNLNLLYATATGDRGNFLVFPLNRVRWLTPPRDIAALAIERSPHSFSAELFHFGKCPRRMGAELYLLKPGQYTLAVVDEAGLRLAAPTPVSVDGPRTRIYFTLPPRKRCRVHVVRRANR
jgi:hypothetical protein